MENRANNMKDWKTEMNVQLKQFQSLFSIEEGVCS